MRKNILLSLVFVLLAQWAAAQTPKWAEKARKAVFSVITYDQEDKILRTGNGFFVSESGTGLSDYTLFKDAYRAVVIDADGVTVFRYTPVRTRTQEAATWHP